MYQTSGAIQGCLSVDELIGDPHDIFTMRAPCKNCGWAEGRVKPVGGQDVVRCDRCDRACYNQPHSESGKPQRSIRTGPLKIDPGRRKDILDRDGWRCAACGRGPAQDAILHIDHAVNIDDGLKLGLSPQELNSDENLITLCEECNLGKSNKPIELRLLVAVMKRRRWPA